MGNIGAQKVMKDAHSAESQFFTTSAKSWLSSIREENKGQVGVADSQKGGVSTSSTGNNEIHIVHNGFLTQAKLMKPSIASGWRTRISSGSVRGC
jgi:hypothetical protein